MEAGRGAVESDVAGDRARGRLRIQGLEIGALVHEPASGDLPQKLGAQIGHDDREQPVAGPESAFASRSWQARPAIANDRIAGLVSRTGPRRDAMLKPLKTAIGLMSGTSLDGVDAALLESDGERAVRRGESLTIPYDTALRETLRACCSGAGDVPEGARLLTLKAAEAVHRLLDLTGLAAGDIDVIGFHGQTIAHRPAERLTWQIGDGALLARRTGIDVVCDFRSGDIAAGGEGAPLAPLYHAALAASLDLSPVAVLNVGGIANVTWIGAGGVIAFDTGPGGALLDDWILGRTGEAFDRDGGIAASGRCRRDLVDAALDGNPWFSRPPPKSLDRGDIAIDLGGLTTADGAATLVALTAERGAPCAALHARRRPRCGSCAAEGRRNRCLLDELRRGIPADVKVAEDIGWDGDALEAEAFAFLAVRSLAGLPLSLPSTTGCREAVTGGALHRARTRAPR